MSRLSSSRVVLLLFLSSALVGCFAIGGNGGNVVADDKVFVEYTAVPAPDGWNLVPHMESHFMNQYRYQLTNITFAMKQHNMEYLEAFVLEAADPTSPHYGEQFTNDEITKIVGLKNNEIAKFQAWIDSVHQPEGSVIMRFLSLSTNRDFITVETTLHSLEQILGCKFQQYRHGDTRKVVVRSVENYRLPANVGEMVDFVVGIHGFPYQRRRVSSPSVHKTRSAFQVDEVTPQDVYKRYNVTEPTSTNNYGSSQAVVEFAADYYSPSDLQGFFQTYLPNLSGQVVKGVYGYNNDSAIPSEEANLDVQWIMAMGQYVDTYVYSYVNANNPPIEDDFLQWVADIESESSPPLVQSVSYGDYGGMYSNATVQRLTQEFIKTSARRVTILFASGDDGVGCNGNCSRFAFPFPSTPYITLVGSTQFNNDTSETGASFSSGGFSDDFWMPAWQSKAVKSYLNKYKPDTKWFNASGRALPDVSTLGVNGVIVQQGSPTTVSGTSLSSPLLAGFIGLWNAYRLSQNKPALGLINPLFYKLAASNPAAFAPITSGNNGYGCCPGFDCTPGWNPVTGLGVPNYGIIFEAVKQLP